MPMFDPPHPGRVLKDGLDGLPMTVTAFAAHIGVSRVLVSRVINGKSGITADLSIRLSEAFGQQTPNIWLKMQHSHDLWQATHAKRTKVRKLDF